MLCIIRTKKMKDPTRRNRNIGTSKQGYGSNNRLVIPWPAIVMKSFEERLTNYTKEGRTINGNRFEFVIEQTREDSFHSCTINDCAELLRHIPPVDYGRLNLIILRQPKRKEEILNSVWGRLVYSYKFEGDYRPAVIIESINPNKILKWPKSQSPEGIKELERLKDDGHQIEITKREYKINYSPKSIRATQLYRTLPHEIGHYKHYLELVGELEDSPDSETYEEYEERENKYHNLNTDIKEKYAHNYADKFRKQMIKVGIIPFEQTEDEKSNYA